MQLDDKTRGEMVLGMEAAFRDSLKASCSTVTQDPEEQHQIAGAVVALMLKRMYQDRGQAWLEQVIRMVLSETTSTASEPSAST